MVNSDLSVFLFDDIQVDARTFQVFKADALVQLEPKTLNLLLFLIENRQRLIEKGEILDSVWKETNVTENALTREIAKLRRVLGDDPKRARYIQTVHTRGYRFIADVTLKNIYPNVDNGAATSSAKQNQVVAALPEIRSHTGSGAAWISSSTFAALSQATDTKKAGGFRHLAARRLFPLVGLLFIFSLAAVVAWKFYPGPVRLISPSVVEIMPVTTAPELHLNPTFSPDGNSVAYSSDRSGGFEIYAKPLTSGGRELQLTSDANQNMEPAWSPNGEFIAYHSAKAGGIWLMPVLGGVAKQLTEFGCHPAWSRDGLKIAFQSESFHDMIQPYLSSATIWTVPAQGGSPEQITRPGNPPGGHLFPSWSQDGKRIAFLNADIRSMQIWSIAIAGDQLKRLTTEQTGDKADVVYSPDGESIFFTAGMMMLQQRVGLNTGDPIGEPVKVADLGSTLFRHPSISADGRKVAYSAWTVKSNVWSVPMSPRTYAATGAPVALTNELNSRNGMTAFSPDGKKIAFTSMRRGVGYQIWLMDPDGKNQAQLTTDAQAALSPTWYSSGDKIAFYCVRGGRSTLSSLVLESHKERVLTDAEGLEALRLSPDGKQIVFTYAPDNLFNIGVMSVEDGERRQLTFEKSFAGLPCWSPDGKFLAFQVKRGDDMQIMLMSASGRTPIQLTFDRGDKWPYSWSPDGDKIAFASSRNGVWNVRWISLSDKTEKQLTSNTKLGAIVRFPDWSPSGDQIIYENTEVKGNIYVMYMR